MAYKKVYPSKLKFDFKDNMLSVRFDGETKYSPDIWGIKYFFDKGMGSVPVRICINGNVSKTMALRMYFLKELFPNIEFHDSEGDKYIADAAEIINNIGTKYVTYKTHKTYKSSDYAFDNRATKNKLEFLIEKELADNLSQYISDFPTGAKVIRQFPANIFEHSISEKSRRTDKLWIDMVSVNDKGELSPIELKVGGNIPLDLFAQGLDYGIYCHLFKEHIGASANWFNGHNDIAQNKVTIYYVGEQFHPALVGRGGEKGIISLIRNNELFNIVFVKIKVNKNDLHITRSKVFFDIRNQ
ncbi:hypothetical protein ACFL3Q_09710 [Planctomycetota bacterium]